MSDPEFRITECFGWMGDPPRVFQLWISEDGRPDWRELPKIIEGFQPKRADAIAGFVPEDEEGDE